MPRKAKRGGPGPGDRARLVHMLAASEQAVSFVQGRRREELDTDHMLRRALISAAQEVGEAAARTTNAGRCRVAGVPWGQIVETRHILEHVDWGVDLDRVWKTATVDLPPFIEALRATLAEWPE